MPQTDQLVWYREKVCLLTPEDPWNVVDDAQHDMEDEQKGL